MTILMPIVIVTAIGLVGAGVLVVVAHIMHVPEDERIALVQDIMPGANCGACGYAGCADYAKAIVEGAPVNKCIPGGTKCAEDAAAIMGVAAGEVQRRTAVVACQGNFDNTQDKYTYQGIKSCAACAELYGGSATCPYGCMGYGDCKSACKFNAVIIKNGVAIIDQTLCTGCGACEIACPKNIIQVLPDSDIPVVLCANKDRGAMTRKACTAGCIGCMKCQKICEFDAIHVKDNVALIDHEKCTGCRKCAEVCPVKAIGIPRTKVVLGKEKLNEPINKFDIA